SSALRGEWSPAATIPPPLLSEASRRSATRDRTFLIDSSSDGDPLAAASASGASPRSSARLLSPQSRRRRAARTPTQKAPAMVMAASRLGTARTIGRGLVVVFARDVSAPRERPCTPRPGAAAIIQPFLGAGLP